MRSARNPPGDLGIGKSPGFVPPIRQGPDLLRDLVNRPGIGITNDLETLVVVVPQQREHEPADGMDGEIRREIADPNSSIRCRIVFVRLAGLGGQRPGERLVPDRMLLVKLSRTELGEHVQKVEHAAGSTGVRLDPPGPPIQRNRLLKFPGEAQRVRQVSVRLGIIGFDSKRLPVGGNCRVEIAAILQCRPQVVQNLVMVGPQRQRLAVLGDGLRDVPAGLEHQAQVVQGVGIVGLNGQRLLQRR